MMKNMLAEEYWMCTDEGNGSHEDSTVIMVIVNKLICWYVVSKRGRYVVDTWSVQYVVGMGSLCGQYMVGMWLVCGR